MKVRALAWSRGFFLAGLWESRGVGWIDCHRGAETQRLGWDEGAGQRG